jgi:hypothetical protein
MNAGRILNANSSYFVPNAILQEKGTFQYIAIWKIVSKGSL